MISSQLPTPDRAGAFQPLGAAIFAVTQRMLLITKFVPVFGHIPPDLPE
jgi:hypothetical protein